MGSKEGSSVDRALWRESSKRHTNMASGRRVTSALSESSGWWSGH